MLAVIACNVLEEEVRHLAANCRHIHSLVFLPQGLHNEPARLQRVLQEAVSAAEAEPTVDAIALVYGLCSRGVENLRHERCPIVIARAHDCVTLFLGDKDRYAEYLRQHPGTYWYSPGWIRSQAPPGPERTARLRREYAERFDADEVEYLMEMEAHWIANYNRAAYVGLGVGETAKDKDYTRHCAACLGWDFDLVQGDPALLRALLAGEWDERRFLIVPPGHGIRLTADDAIIRAVPLPPAP
ncbi:MAG: hypothetical protein QG602_3668 [Verrucomicrobiota bacterium]|nr:hypothetical protein [Verrucomicrobiota bacterium]